MKITRIETVPICVPLRPELAIRSGRGGAHLVSPFLLVKIHTDEGIVGLGEASCTPRWSGEDQTTAAHFINDYFAPQLVGEVVDCSTPLLGRDAADEVARLATRFCSIVAGNPFTKAAVEMALWDILGKAHDRPVWEIATRSGQRTERQNAASALQGPRAPLRGVPNKWSVSGVEPTKAAEIAVWAVSAGFSTMKVKVGTDPDGDLARVRAVREAVGPDVKLGVDANGGWPTPRIAIDAIRRLHDQCAIYFAEQPLPPGDPDALADVRRNALVPIVADESIWTLEDAKRLARAGAADVFSIYIGKAGGLGPALAIAEFADSAGIKCTIGSNLELGVGTAAMIHLALSAPAIDANAFPCDIIGPLFYEDDILAEPITISVVGGLGKECRCVCLYLF
jgi:muconate cycloisomerase